FRILARGQPIRRDGERVPAGHAHRRRRRDGRRLRAGSDREVAGLSRGRQARGGVGEWSKPARRAPTGRGRRRTGGEGRRGGRSEAELREEHARLWRKRQRYRTQKANVEQIGRQIARVEDRMALRIKELVPNDREAVDHLRRELEAARGQRYTIKGV